MLIFQRFDLEQLVVQLGGLGGIMRDEILGFGQVVAEIVEFEEVRLARRETVEADQFPIPMTWPTGCAAWVVRWR